MFSARGAGSGTTRWALDEGLPGAGLDDATTTARTLDDLSSFLRALHACPLDAVRAWGIPAVPAPDPARLLRAAQDALREVGLPGTLVVPPSAAAGPVLLHADLKGEHLLVDDAGGLTGVLDWSDAGTGDPALDVEGLVLAVGERAAHEVAHRAGTPSAAVDRGIFLARCRSALRWAAVRRGEPAGPEPLLRRQFTAAWGRTPG